MEEWCIRRVVGDEFRIVGYVWAADEATALREAINRFDLVGREHEIVAHPVPQSGS
jgi:hypothetical protein